MIFKTTYITTLYTLLFTGGAFFSFYKFGLLAKILDKPDFGLYSLVLSSYIYLIYLFSLGANEFVLKVGSFQRSNMRKKIVRSTALANGLFFLTLSVSLILLFAIPVTSTEQYILLVMCCLLALSALPFSIFESYFRTQGALLKFSGMMCFKALFVVALLYLFQDKITLYGAVLVELLGFVFLVLICTSYFARNKEPIITNVSFKRTKWISAHGYAFSLSTMAKNGICVVDRILVAFFLGALSLAYYSFTMLVYLATTLASGFIMSVVGPKMIGLFRDGLSVVRISNLAMWLVGLILLLSLILYIPADLIYKSVVSNYFEKYDIPITYSLFSVIYFSSFIFLCTSLLDWLFILVSKERMLLKFHVVNFVFTTALFFVVGYWELGLLAFSIIFLLSRIFLFIADLYFIIFHVSGSDCVNCS